MPLVLARVGIEYNHPPIAISIGNVQLIRLRIDDRFRWQTQILKIVAALALVRLANSASGTFPTA